MSHYRKTNPATAMSNLIRHAQIVQRWAEHEGTASQKEIANMLLKAIVTVTPKLTPNNLLPLKSETEYAINKTILAAQQPVYDIAAMNAANQHEYDQGRQAAIDGKSIDDDNPHHWQDDKRWSAWNRGFSDQIKATNPEGNYD